MNIGYRDNYNYGIYLKQLEEQRIAEKGTPEERKQLQELYSLASEAAGKEHCEFSSLETTDKGVQMSAHLMSRYRILLAEIRHRTGQV